MAKAAAVKAVPAKVAPAPAPAPIVEEVPAGEEAALFEGTGEDGFVVDMSGVDENSGGFTVLPRGMYPAILNDCSFGLSQRSGNPMWTWEFEVDSGDFAGRKLYFHLPFTPNMLPRIKKVLARIAPDLAAQPFDPKQVADEGTLSGVRAKLRVDTRRYEGEMRNNVRDVLPPEPEGGGADFLQT